MELGHPLQPKSAQDIKGHRQIKMLKALSSVCLHWFSFFAFTLFDLTDIIMFHPARILFSMFISRLITPEETTLWLTLVQTFLSSPHTCFARSLSKNSNLPSSACSLRRHPYAKISLKVGRSDCGSSAEWLMTSLPALFLVLYPAMLVFHLKQVFVEICFQFRGKRYCSVHLSFHCL